MTRTHRLAATICWLALLLAAGWMLLHLEPATAPPGWTSPREWTAWAAHHDPVDVLVAVARPVGVVLVGYLVLVTSVQLVPQRRGGRIRGAIRRVTPGLVLTLTAGLAATSPVGAQVPEPAPGPAIEAGRGATMELVSPGSGPGTTPLTHLPWSGVVAEDPPTTTTSSTTMVGPVTAVPSTAPHTTAPPRTSTTSHPPATAGAGRRVDPLRDITPTTRPPSPATTSTSTSTPTVGRPSNTPARPTPETVAASPVAAPTPDPATTLDAGPARAIAPDGVHVVQPGDHLWSIAEQELAQLGAPTDERSVATYWRTLVETNRDRLVDPDDPDLILPGQRIVLPGV